MKRMMSYPRLFAASVAMSLMLFAGPSFGRLVSHAFATHHLVIQISNGSGPMQHLVLNNVTNVLNHFGPDKVQVEVVAFGPGIRLLLKHNVFAMKVHSLYEQGVEFAACHNTMMHLHLTKADLNPVTRVVPGGIVEIMRRQSEGWNYIRP